MSNNFMIYREKSTPIISSFRREQVKCAIIIYLLTSFSIFITAIFSWWIAALFMFLNIAIMIYTSLITIKDLCNDYDTYKKCGFYIERIGVNVKATNLPMKWEIALASKEIHNTKKEKENV